MNAVNKKTIAGVLASFTGGIILGMIISRRKGANEDHQSDMDKNERSANRLKKLQRHNHLHS